MKSYLQFLVLTLVVLSIFLYTAHLVEAKSSTKVNGYMRNNGSYTRQYNRSKPDKNYNNNWSLKPNINPYTGKSGNYNPTWDGNKPSKSNNRRK